MPFPHWLMSNLSYEKSYEKPLIVPRFSIYFVIHLFKEGLFSCLIWNVKHHSYSLYVFQNIWSNLTWKCSKMSERVVISCLFVPHWFWINVNVCLWNITWFLQISQNSSNWLRIGCWYFVKLSFISVVELVFCYLIKVCQFLGFDVGYQYSFFLVFVFFFWCPDWCVFCKLLITNEYLIFFINLQITVNAVQIWKIKKRFYIWKPISLSFATLRPYRKKVDPGKY